MLLEQLVGVFGRLFGDTLIYKERNVMPAFLQGFGEACDGMLSSTADADGRQHPTNIELALLHLHRSVIWMRHEIRRHDIFGRSHNIQRTLSNQIS